MGGNAVSANMAAGKLGRGAPEGLGLGIEITGGVVGHDNDAEQDRYDAGSLFASASIQDMYGKRMSSTVSSASNFGASGPDLFGTAGLQV